MSMDEDLPLFAWKPPVERKFIAFPIDKRVGKIRRVAEVLCKRHREGRATTTGAAYWKTETKNLREWHLSLGYTPEEAERQIDLFQAAVQAELNRMHLTQQKDEKSQ